MNQIAFNGEAKSSMAEMAGAVGGVRGQWTSRQRRRVCGFRAWLLVGDPDPQALVGSSARLEILHLPARKAPHLGDGCG